MSVKDDYICETPDSIPQLGKDFTFAVSDKSEALVVVIHTGKYKDWHVELANFQIKEDEGEAFLTVDETILKTPENTEEVQVGNDFRDLIGSISLQILENVIRLEKELKEQENVTDANP